MAFTQLFRNDPNAQGNHLADSLFGDAQGENLRRNGNFIVRPGIAHPHVSMTRGADFDALHTMYIRAHLFGPHIDRNLAPIVDEARQTWRKLHEQAPDVARTLVHGPADSPDGAVTIVRAWEHAWVLQHFVDVSPEINGATGRLQFAYLDHLLPRPDGRYLLFFVKDDNQRMNAYLERFFACTGTPDAVTRSQVELWSHPGEDGRPTVETDMQLRRLTADDEPVLMRASQRCLGHPWGRGLACMTPGLLDLPDTRRRFERAGLLRERRCHVIESEGQLLYALVEERATP